jgi:hypothetical protein
MTNTGGWPALNLDGHKDSECPVFRALCEGAGGPGFDLAGTKNTVGAPFFAYFAKGGYRNDR